MNFKTLIAAGLILLAGCATREPFVKVAEENVPKSTAIYVSAIAEVLTLTIDKEGLKIEKSTAPVRYAGAGVFITHEGHVLTCAHLFNAGEITGITVCRPDGLCQGGEVLYKDDRRDLALVKVEGWSPAVRIGDPRKLKVGQQVVAIGNPLGLESTVTHGIISALNRDFSFRYDATQSDAPINPGNSGGPLFNLDGELIGINSFIIPPVNANIFTGLGFSVSTNQIIEFLTKFRGVDKSIPRLGTDYWQGFKDALGLGSSN